MPLEELRIALVKQGEKKGISDLEISFNLTVSMSVND